MQGFRGQTASPSVFPSLLCKCFQREEINLNGKKTSMVRGGRRDLFPKATLELYTREGNSRSPSPQCIDAFLYFFFFPPILNRSHVPSVHEFSRWRPGCPGCPGWWRCVRIRPCVSVLFRVCLLFPRSRNRRTREPESILIFDKR